jgi:hypothetical protein
MLLYTILTAVLVDASSPFGQKETSFSILTDTLQDAAPQPLAAFLVDPRSSTSCKKQLKDSNTRVVMGLGSGYAWHQLEPFIVSLRFSGFCGTIVLGVKKDAPVNLLSKLREHCVVALAVPGKVSKRNHPNEVLPPASARFILYKDWIAQLDLPDHAWVLLADVRDTVFQRDPFSVLPPVSAAAPTPGGVNTAPASALYLFGDAIPLHRCATPACNALSDIDTHSYLNLFNAVNNASVQADRARWFAQASMDSLVLCSGTTMGTIDAVKVYLAAMAALFHALDEFSNSGVDQGYHNWVYYSRRWLDNVATRVFRPGEPLAPVLTMNSISDFSKARAPFPEYPLPRDGGQLEEKTAASGYTVVGPDSNGYIETGMAGERMYTNSSVGSPGEWAPSVGSVF